MKNKSKHPLEKYQPQHYSQGTSAIKELEKQLSVAAMTGFCEGNIFKYEYRQDNKGQKESDIKKIKVYKAYLDELKVLLHKGHAKLTVSHAFEIEGIVYE